MDVSVIIVNYNTKSLLKDCLDSIYKFTKELDFEVIVSDNGSTDGSIEMLKSNFPQVILIENNENLGFGKANNRGLKIAQGKYIFYLNSDTVLLNNAVKFFFDYWENSTEKENIGALGANLLDRDMEYNNGYDYMPRTLNFKNYVYNTIKSIYGFYKLSFKYLILGKPFPAEKKKKYIQFHIGKVSHITGASLFLLNDNYAFFDPNYFMYYEETDLERRLKNINKNFFIINGPRIIHYCGASSEKRQKRTLLTYYKSFSYTQCELSKCYYYSKHGIGAFKIAIIKFLTFLLWINPLLFNDKKKYFFRLLIA